MADLPVGPTEVRERIKSQMKAIAKAPPHIKQKWLETRRKEMAARVQNKENEIEIFRNVRLSDMEIELEIMKLDLEVLAEMERVIQTKGIEYLDNNIKKGE